MKRKGISFTLTLVVIGVVLLMTALTVIVVGGGEISSFIQNLGETRGETEVSQQCNQIAQTIQNRYCDRWAAFTESGDPGSAVGSVDSCREVKTNRDPDHAKKANEMSCDWYAMANNGGSDAPGINLVTRSGGSETTEPLLGDVLTWVDSQSSWEPIVTREDGSQYNCLNQGDIDRTCPIR